MSFPNTPLFQSPVLQPQPPAPHNTLFSIDAFSRDPYSVPAMAKQVVKVIKAQAKGGQANPAPPLGPVLGQAGIDIAGFCQKFNDKTKNRMGQVVPVVIKVYNDRSFTFELKQSPASSMIKERAKLEKGSGEPNKNKVGKLTKAQVKEIAEIKMPDLNTKDLQAAMRIIEGTARSMGVTVE